MTHSAEDPMVSNYAAEHFPKASPWVGWIGFAGVMLALLGAFRLFQGIVALVNEDYFQSRSSGLVLAASHSTWGWGQIIGGVILVVAGLCVFGGQVWARAVGVLVAFASAVANLAFMAEHPLFSAIMIAVDIVVIFALTVHGSEIRP